MLLALAASAALAQSARVVLRWKPVENARRYQLQIARDDTFKDVVVDTMVDTAGFRWDELPNVVYHWRVRSFDADERPSQWSPPRAISAAAGAPAVKTPGENVALDCRVDGVDLVVDATQVFKEYVLQLSDDAAFSGHVQQQSNTTGRFKVVLAPGVWHWRVHAIDVAGRQTESTAPRILTVSLAAPRPRPTPDGVLGSKDITLAWDDVPCASRYQVEATLEAEPPVPLAASGTTTGFKTVRAGEYRWRVSALDARGAPGAFSAWTSFKVRLPGPRAGADVSGREVTLGWAATAGSTGYRVEVAASADFRPLAAQASVEGTSWKPAPLPAGTYLWRVTARDAGGRWSGPSEVRRWTVPDAAPPAVPEFVAPAEGKVERPDDGRLEVRWGEVAGAASYDLQLDQGPVLSRTETAHTFTAVAPGAHQLKLRSRGPGATPSEWAWRDITFGRAPLARVLLQPASPSSGGPKVTLYLRAVDATGATVPPEEATVRAERGELGAPRRTADGWAVEYTPPPQSARARKDVLHVAVGAHRETLELSLERGAFAAALSVGGRFSGGAVTSPTVDVGVILTPGWLWGRLNLELRAGFYAVGSTLMLPQGFSVEASAQLFPISLLVGWTQPLFGLEWRLAAGFALQLAALRLDGESSFAAVPSLDVGLGVAMPLGPGAIEARLGYLWGRVETDLRFQAGGFGVCLGYRIDLPAVGGP